MTEIRHLTDTIEIERFVKLRDESMTEHYGASPCYGDGPASTPDAENKYLAAFHEGELCGGLLASLQSTSHSPRVGIAGKSHDLTNSFRNLKHKNYRFCYLSGLFLIKERRCLGLYSILAKYLATKLLSVNIDFVVGVKSSDTVDKFRGTYSKNMGVEPDLIFNIPVRTGFAPLDKMQPNLCCVDHKFILIDQREPLGRLKAIDSVGLISFE